MIDILLKFANKAGKTLRKRRKYLNILYNKDSSIGSMVTSEDLFVSNMFERIIKKHFSHLDYMIIDEEKIASEKNIFSKIKQTEYQFVIDPIDGTIQYANNHPLYGISIGVYKNAQPLLGIIYLPELGELTYFDGKKAYWVQNAFSKEEIKQEILPNTKPSFPIIFGHPWLWNLSDDFSTSKAFFLDYFSAVSQSFYTIIGKATAYCMYLNLWDIAGTIPIANYLGLKIYEYGSDKTFDKISAEFFNPDMSCKNFCILCYPKEYKKICKLISAKKSDNV